MSINTSRGRTSNTRPFTILPSLNSRDGDRASSSFMSVMDCVLHLGLPLDLHSGQPTLDANHREGRRKVGTAEPKASSNSFRETDAARSRGNNLETRKPVTAPCPGWFVLSVVSARNLACPP